MKQNLCMLLAAAFLAMCCAACGQEELPKMEPEVTQMRAICELATMDCYYHTVAKYYDENAEQFLWMSKDKKFWIEYGGVVRLGVDASQVSIAVDGTDVTITMPDAMVLGSKVNETSLTEDSYIVDKDSADVTAEDQTAAFGEAQQQLEETARQNTALLAEAKQRAKSLLENYVNNIGDEMGVEYTIHWVDISAESPAADHTQSEGISSGTTAEDSSAPAASE